MCNCNNLQGFRAPLEDTCFTVFSWKLLFLFFLWGAHSDHPAFFQMVPAGSGQPRENNRSGVTRVVVGGRSITRSLEPHAEPITPVVRGVVGPPTCGGGARANAVKSRIGVAAEPHVQRKAVWSTIAVCVVWVGRRQGPQRARGGKKRRQTATAWLSGTWTLR